MSEQLLYVHKETSHLLDSSMLALLKQACVDVVV